MVESVGNCVKCGRPITCIGGFLNGIVLQDNTVICFGCHEIVDEQQTL